MALLIFVQVAALGVAWRQMILYSQPLGEFSIEKYAGPMGMAFTPYVVFFVPLALWHLFDLLDKESEPDNPRPWYGRYRFFGLMLLLCSPFAVAGVVEGYLYESCEIPGVAVGKFVFTSCQPPTFTQAIFTFVVVPSVLSAIGAKFVSALISNRRELLAN